MPDLAGTHRATMETVTADGTSRNWKLIEARRAKGWSQQRLAHEAAAWIRAELDIDRPADRNYIGKLEAGKIRWPADDYRAAYRALLNRTTDEGLGFVPPTPRPSDETGDDAAILSDMERRDVLRGAAAAALTPAGLSAALDAINLDPSPGRVGQADIDRIHAARDVYRSLGFSRGGGFALAGGVAQLRWATKLLDAQCPERLQPALHSAIGAMADDVGFTAFDAGRLDVARRCMEVGLSCATEANDVSLRLWLLVDLAEVAMDAGRPREAIGHLDAVDTSRLSQGERALLWSKRARAAALLGDERATLAAVGAGDEAFTSATEDDPRWADMWTLEHHNGRMGRALYALVVTNGQGAPPAVQRLSAAVDGYGDGYVRHRALDMTRQATVLMVAGDPDEAARVGLAAVDATGRVESNRTTEYLRTLHQVAASHTDRPAVAELRARTSDLLLA